MNLKVMTYVKNRFSGKTAIISNTHLFWDPVRADIKVAHYMGPISINFLTLKTL